MRADLGFELEDHCPFCNYIINFLEFKNENDEEEIIICPFCGNSFSERALKTIVVNNF
ncbi:MAG: hypothetical protein HUJ68_04945 [Clostridia bacterium]|nr:hypothetical protein [Clostridia bacterium]